MSVSAHGFTYLSSLLVAAFNQFTFIFKVIVGMYELITIFLIALGLFCVCLFLFLYFLPRELPLAFVVMLV